MVSPEASLLGWQRAGCSLCPHVTFFLCACIPGISSSSCKDTTWWTRFLPLWDLINLNYIFKGSVSKIVTLRVESSMYDFGGRSHNSHPKPCEFYLFLTQKHIMDVGLKVQYSLKNSAPSFQGGISKLVPQMVDGETNDSHGHVPISFPSNKKKMDLLV